MFSHEKDDHCFSQLIVEFSSTVMFSVFDPGFGKPDQFPVLASVVELVPDYQIRDFQFEFSGK